MRRWGRDLRRGVVVVAIVADGAGAGCAITVPVRDPWPGDPARGARLLKGELDHAGGTLRLRPGEWGEAESSPVLLSAAHGFTWLRDLRALGTDAARGRARALVADWIGLPPNPLTRRPDIAGARLAAWLGHWDFFAASADDAFPHPHDGPPGRRRPRAGRRPAGRGAGCPRPDRAEGFDRRRRGAAGPGGVPDPCAALPAAGDRAPGAARWLPRRTQPRRPIGRAAGSGRDPRLAAGRTGAAARRPGQRDRPHGPGVAGDAPWAMADWRCSTAARKIRRP